MTLDALSIIHFKKGFILDLGCGTGFSTLAVKGSGFDVVGVDSSVEMIVLAAGKGLDKLVAGDFVHLPFKSNVFSGIISISSIQWLSPEQYSLLVGELRRVLMPGGKIIIQYYPENDYEKKLFLRQARKAGFKTVVQEVGSGRKRKEFTVLC